jgi:RNA 2',3'-cyclic 3'-phosphodiesterase
MRTFIAFELPSHVQTQVQRVQQAAQEQLAAAKLDRMFRWTDVKNLHLTLRFLGDTEAAHLPTLAQTLEEAFGGQPVIKLGIGELGSFPRWRQPRVIWLGLTGELDRLNALQDQVEAMVQAVGYAPETKAFSPHIKVGRASRNASSTDLEQAGQQLKSLAASAELMQPSFTVDEIVHLQSDLRPGGPVYTSLSRIRLGG